MARYVHIQENDIQEIGHSYNLTVTSFENIAGGQGNSSFLLSTPEGNYVLTVFDDKKTEHVAILGKLLQLLAEHNFPTTRLLPTPTGSFMTMYLDKPVILKAYIPGRVFKELDEAMLNQIGTTIARLHQIPISALLPEKHSYGLQFFKSIIGKKINTEYEDWLAKRLDYIEKHIPSGIPKGLIHGDLFYDNVLFEGNKLKAILDFEEACCYYMAFDLGMAIVGLCTEGATLSLEKSRALVAGYQQTRKLIDQEKKGLQLFVEYAAVATSCWRFWKYQIHRPIPEKADKYLEMWRLAEEVSDIPPEKFINIVFA